MRDRLDALLPERLVEFGIETDVLGAHRLLGELDDRLDGPGCPLLEGAAMYTFVHMDCVFARHNIGESGALASLVLHGWYIGIGELYD